MEKDKSLRAVITVVGVDRVGIIARITAKLAALGINILDISQTIMRHPARFAWQEVTKVAHYRLEMNAMTRPMRLREELKPYGKDAP